MSFAQPAQHSLQQILQLVVLSWGVLLQRRRRNGICCACASCFGHLSQLATMLLNGSCGAGSIFHQRQACTLEC